MRFGLLLLAVLLGCGRDTAPAPEGPVVARVGDIELKESDLVGALGRATPGLDSAAARRQVIEQWVRRQLVVQAARREGLDTDPEVQARIQDSESSVLEAAFLSRFFEATPATPSEDEIAAYFESNRQQLALREPYVRVRLLRLKQDSDPQTALRALQQVNDSPIADSLFALAAREYTADPEGAIELANSFIPESRLLALNEALGLRIASMAPGASPIVIPAPEAAYAVSVVDRVRAGQVPSLDMIRPEIVETLSIRARKEAEARLIAQLRSEAEAGGRLEVR